MSGPVRLNLQIGGPTTKLVKEKSLADVVAWIESKSYSDEVKKELITTVSKYPSGTYKNFMKDIHKHVIKIRKRIKTDVREKE